MKTALVHDWLFQIGGAEDVLENLVDMFPDAPVYTSVYVPEKMPAHWQTWDIRTSYLDHMPLAHWKPQLYFSQYHRVFERFDFSAYDLVITNKSGFCHGIVTGPETLHLCYCLTPTRYVWRYHQYAARENLNQMVRWMLEFQLPRLRTWDRLAAERVDHFIAISEAVRHRISKIYRRESTIIYPPVDTSRFQPASGLGQDYYLFVGRLVPYRRLDLLIEAFNKLQRPLVIVGRGRDRERLEALANSNISFLGYVPDEELPDLFANCRAFMWPGEEDFGIAPIQAMAAGRPVLAYAAGGVLDTVIPGATGDFFTEQSVNAIIRTVEGFDDVVISPSFIRHHAEQFDTSVFHQKLNAFIEQKLEEKYTPRSRYEIEREWVVDDDLW